MNVFIMQSDMRPAMQTQEVLSIHAPRKQGCSSVNVCSVSAFSFLSVPDTASPGSFILQEPPDHQANRSHPGWKAASLFRVFLCGHYSQCRPKDLHQKSWTLNHVCFFFRHVPAGKIRCENKIQRPCRPTVPAKEIVAGRIKRREKRARKKNQGG